MEQSFTLIRLINNVEAEADASNDVRVTYKKPIVDIIKGGVDFEQAESVLKLIEEEINFLKDLQEQRSKIFQTNKRNSDRELKVIQLEETICENKIENKFIKKLYTRPHNLFDTIEKRLEEIAGTYLIIPSFHKEFKL